MKKRLIIFFCYALFWLCFFIISKILFLLYHISLSSELGFIESFRVIIHGLKLDISLTGYILMFSGLLFTFTSFSEGKWLKYILNSLTILLLFVFCTVIVSDLELYRNWGYRMDTTPLLYLATPEEAVASINPWLISLLIALIIVFFTVSLFFYLKYFNKMFKDLRPGNWKPCLSFLLLSAVMILPIRGGFGIAPINTGTVYFSNNTFANHAAVNVIWNLAYSLVNLKSVDNPYLFLEKDEAKNIVNGLYNDHGKTMKVLNSEQPNILVIILESFTSKIIEVLGGEKGITPNFNKLSKEGILFKNFYASGDRSDKGLVSILSGYPAQPVSSIINFPQKTQSLPFITRDLKKEGYHTALYYGGDIDFANFRSYFINAQFDDIISKDDFEPSTYNAKWGVHDHIVFNKFFKDINESKIPFFKVLFTLSSHEPFDVPMETVIAGEGEENKFFNSAFYTDKCIGEFIEKVKKKTWWENTLIIFLADHGARLPGNSTNFEEMKFKIPMLWIGGAINKHDTVITTYSSQTDIPKTILNQINIKNNQYVFSKDIFSVSCPSFAFYSFNNGFGFMRDDIHLVFDNISKQYIIREGKFPETDLAIGKAYLQVLYSDFMYR